MRGEQQVGGFCAEIIFSTWNPCGYNGKRFLPQVVGFLSGQSTRCCAFSFADLREQWSVEEQFGEGGATLRAHRNQPSRNGCNHFNRAGRVLVSQAILRGGIETCVPGGAPVVAYPSFDASTITLTKDGLRQLLDMAKYTRNAGKSWTSSEVSKMKTMIDQNTPTRVIGLKLGRPVGGVYSKASQMGLSLAPTNQSPYNRK